MQDLILTKVDYSCFQTYKESRNLEIVICNGSGGKTPKLPCQRVIDNGPEINY